MLSTYYVATNGSDSAGTGTTSAPFLTIQKAISAIGSTGTGTVEIETGTYFLDNGNSTYNTGGIAIPTGATVTLTQSNYNGGPVYIVGGVTINSSDSNGWTDYSGNVWETTLSGTLGYVSNSPTNTYATVQEIFENFNASALGSQTVLKEYGTTFGFTDYYRENKLALPSGLIADLPANSWYMPDTGTGSSGVLSNVLYVNVGGGSPGTELTASSPQVLQDLYGLTSSGGRNSDGAINCTISGITFEISDSAGSYDPSDTNSAFVEFCDGDGDGYSDNIGTVDIGTTSQFLNSNIYWAPTQALEIHTNSVLVKGADIYDFGCTGIDDEGATAFTIEECDIENGNTRDFDVQWAAAGVKMSRASTTVSSYGTITESQFANDNSCAIWTDTDDATGHLIVFSDNYIHDDILSPLDYTTTTPVLGSDAGGIKVEVSCYVNVYNNIITNDGPVGILIAGSEHCNVDNNTVSNNVGFAAIELNTDGNRTNVKLVNGTYFQLLDNNVENNIISHNVTTYDLVMDTLPSSATNAGGQPLAEDNYSDYNLFYRLGEPVQLSWGDVDDNEFSKDLAMGNLETSLSAWTAITSAPFVYQGKTYDPTEEDAHSIVADPLYANVTTIPWSYNQSTGAYVAGNYYVISSGSPARGRGDPSVTISNTDYQGTSRTAPYDIGAFQYNGDPGQSPYTTPTLNGEAWVDDTLPQGAVVYDMANTFEYLSGGSYVTANSSSVDVMPLMWANTSSGSASNAPYEWGSGVESGANALEMPAFGTAATTADIMSFQDASQDMTINATSDTLFLYVYLAPSSASVKPAGTTPTEIGVSYYDSTQGKWLSGYADPSGSTSTNLQSGTIPILPNYSGHLLTGTPAAGSWKELTITAGALGMAGGDVISGLTLAAYGGEAAFDNIGDMPAVTIGSIKVTPASATVDETATQTFTATAYDQNGNALATQPTFTWSLGNGSYGGINSTTGVYSAPATSGSATVIATADSVSGSATVSIVAATVANQYLFYYGSSAFDGSATSPSSADFNAIATDKSALVPNASTPTTATFANVSSYADGINGILIDFANLKPGITPSAGDFQFAVGNSSTPSSWTTAPSPTTVATWTGSNGDTFADIVWPNNSIQEEWLQVTVLADADTHLASNVVFYFGNLAGATGATVNNGMLQVNTTDVSLTQQNETGFSPAAITNLYDFNRDGSVNTTDVSICQQQETGFGGLQLITVGGSSGGVVLESPNAQTTAATVTPAATASAPPSNDSTSVTASVLQQDNDLLHRIGRHRRQ